MIGKRYRLQIDFSRSHYQRLKEMKKMAGVSSLSRLVHIAIQVFAYVFHALRSGWRLRLVKEETGEVREVEVLF